MSTPERDIEHSKSKNDLPHPQTLGWKAGQQYRGSGLESTASHVLSGIIDVLLHWGTLPVAWTDLNTSALFYLGEVKF